MLPTLLRNQEEQKNSVERIALCFFGTRGDCQPYVSLASGLQARGHIVAAFSSDDKQHFLSDFGIHFISVGKAHGSPSDGWDDKDPKSKPMIDAMTKGSTKKFIQAMKKDSGFIDIFISTTSALMEFKPDLILCGTLAEFAARPVSVKLQIPLIEVRLQLLYPTNDRVGLGLPQGPLPCCGFDNLWMHRKLVEDGFKQGKKLDRISKRVLGVEVWKGITGRAVWDTLLDLPSPCIMIASPHACQEVMYPNLPCNMKLTGFWIIQSGEQTNSAGDSHFGGDDTRRRLEDFLSVGEAPVYMGWGSMLCKSGEHMVLIACGALMECGKRGVICGGWAKLSFDKLQKVAINMANGTSILEYVEQNVLFVTKAPHEWLFPRCACVVHHGGAGTTAASLRAGVPTVIMPIFLDQFDHAVMISRLGVGVGMKQFMKISVTDLATTLTQVCNDTAMMSKAAELGKTLMAEDGVATAVLEIDKAIALHRKGQFRTFVQCARDRQAELNRSRYRLPSFCMRSPKLRIANEHFIE
eukprot:TRINITY_DN22047_c0_g1_i1.p1 TRINITY_DN22047_c0_g1~~TRINITY_DN22047_c0_g1_i1.p1  ORF type:complete len:524 (+),score=87.82 TRINITY_DN22047_c0_g1_i1:55-1626(+)